MKKPELRIGTFNCRGITRKIKKQQLADDMVKMNAAAIATQETKIKNVVTHNIKSSNGNTNLYTTIQETQNHIME